MKHMRKASVVLCKTNRWFYKWNV